MMNEKHFIPLKVESCEIERGTIYRSPNHSFNAFEIFANNLSTILAQCRREKEPFSEVGFS